MTEEERAIFAGILNEVCAAMWSEGTPAPAMADPPASLGDAVVASIGLGGPDFRGALVVLGRPSFFSETYPLPRPRGVGNGELADWAGEIGNQLIGRIKNRVGSLGLDFSISTPTVVRGDRLALGRSGPQTIQTALTIRSERVDVVFEIAQDDGRPLLPAKGAPVVASLEGQGLLF